jgi:hypothetical protein
MIRGYYCAWRHLLILFTSLVQITVRAQTRYRTYRARWSLIIVVFITKQSEMSKYMQHSPCEANSRSDNQEISYVSWNQKVGYRVHNIPQLVSLRNVGIVTGYALQDGGFGVQVPVGSWIFSFPYHPDRPGVHPAYQMSTVVSIPRSKTAGAWKRGSIHPLPHTSSWRST